MSLVSTIWSTVSGVKRGAARAGIFKSAKLDARVISVGNIQVGGAGKTPLVAQIAREGNDRGLRVCILSRGYKSPWEASGGVLLPGQVRANAYESGDEPALLHELCPHAYIGVGANRVQQYQAILEKAHQKMDLVILDDGFQNWQIHKDVEIVALTSAKSKQTIFRDNPTSLKYADLVVWTKGETQPNTLGKPFVRVRYKLPRPAGKVPLWLITGIADGQFAYSLALQSGYQVMRYMSYGDHASYDLSLVQSLLKKANAVHCKVALTGKDWVKWRDLGISLDQVTVLEPELVFEQGKELWSRILWEE